MFQLPRIRSKPQLIEYLKLLVFLAKLDTDLNYKIRPITTTTATVSTATTFNPAHHNHHHHHHHHHNHHSSHNNSNHHHGHNPHHHSNAHTDNPGQQPQLNPTQSQIKNEEFELVLRQFSLTAAHDAKHDSTQQTSSTTAITMKNFELLCVRSIEAFFLHNLEQFAFLSNSQPISNPLLVQQNSIEKPEDLSKRQEDMAANLDILELLYSLSCIVTARQMSGDFTREFLTKYTGFIKLYATSLAKHIDEAIGDHEIEELDEEAEDYEEEEECGSVITKTSGITTSTTNTAATTASSNPVTTAGSSSSSGSSIIDDEFSNNSGSSSSNDDGISSCCSNVSPKSALCSPLPPCSSTRSKESSRRIFLVNARSTCRGVVVKIVKLIARSKRLQVVPSLQELTRAAVNLTINTGSKSKHQSSVMKSFVYFSLPSKAIKHVNFLTHELVDDLYGPGFDLETYVLSG
jgi:hypothetical protein